MRILFVQTGDYGEAWHRFRAGGDENFRDQRRSVAFVEDLAQQHDVTVLARCGRIHDESLRPRLRSIGVSDSEFYDRGKLRRLLDRLAAETMVLSTPDWVVAAWAAANGVALLPIFADRFTRGDLRERYRNWRLARTLKRSRAPCVCNHGLQASRSLKLLGIPPARIVPWEHARIEPDAQPKHASAGSPFRVLFVGQMVHSKGVGDCIDAVAVLARTGPAAALTLFGPGDQGPFRQQVERLALADAVHFGGIVSTDAVRRAMRTHDAVVVASRPEYPEGMPNTIFEALASRTPLVASDHPAFVPRLVHDRNALLFRAGNAADLADQLRRLATTPALYERLSQSSEGALRTLYVGTDGQEILETFLRDADNREGWVARWSLAGLGLPQG